MFYIKKLVKIDEMQEARQLLGKPIANQIDLSTANIVSTLDCPPALQIITLIGDEANDASLSYANSVSRRAKKLGIDAAIVHCKTTNDVLTSIAFANASSAVDAIIVMDDDRLRDVKSTDGYPIATGKDVDCMSFDSQAILYTGIDTNKVVHPFAPCTPEAVIAIMKHYDIPIDGSDVCIVGRSSTVGKPLAHMLTDMNATVTLCHSHTKDVMEHIMESDVVVFATGQPKEYGIEFFSSNQTVIDVSTNVDKDGKMCGDVDFENVRHIVEAITPVPGGVGTVTTSVLLFHVAQAAFNNRSKR